MRAARSRFEVGEGTRTDVAQAEASRSSAVAQLAAARAQALSSAATYHQIVGEEPGKLSSPSAAKGLPKRLDSAIAIANAEHPAIVATEHLVDAAGFTVKSAEGSLLPQVSAIGRRGARLRQHGSRSLPLQQRHLQFGERRLHADGADLPGRAGRRRRCASPRNCSARRASRSTSPATRSALPSSRHGRSTSRRARASRPTASWSSAAELALSGVIEERKVGQRTTLDVLNAQADVITAQINLVSSERDVVVASYAILSAVGHLSARPPRAAVAEYHPEEHYNAVKDKWFGLRTPDGR